MKQRQLGEVWSNDRMRVVGQKEGLRGARRCLDCKEVLGHPRLDHAQ